MRPTIGQRRENGDESAFEELVRGTTQALSRCTRIIHNHEDAEEVCKPLS